MDPTSRPVACSDRMAVSRPEPGPLTKTSTLRIPCSMARRAQASAAICAANGVELRDTLKPTAPEEAHEMTLLTGSVIDTIVLLDVPLSDVLPFLAAHLLGAGTALRRHLLPAPGGRRIAMWGRELLLAGLLLAGHYLLP